MTQSDAVKEKEIGNEFYKKRDFQSAITHYTKAMELDVTDATFVNNLAAVYFELKEYDKCVETCKKAVDVGRENRADFKVIAKALARMGNAYKKANKLAEAKVAYEKALTEHRTPEYKTALSLVESMIKKEAEQAYINPTLAEDEKQKGNSFFKEGKFSEAVKHYSEAIKRNPDDYKIYSNRAACFIKLMSFDLALKDCDKTLEIEPTFIKALLRKAQVYKGMGKTANAKEQYEKAIALDENCSEAIEGYRACSMMNYSDPEQSRKQAMNDPEIQQILGDPAMRMILEQMQSDPKAIQEHLQNPDIASKFMKLREAGLIQVAYK